MQEVRRNQALNALRALAALLVCVGHVRGYLLISKEEAGGGAAVNVTYALTSLGNGAVLVFFVLSGYFVGGSVLRGFRRGAFVWADYLASRTLRLWMVLIPALALTIVLDQIGFKYFPESDWYEQGGQAADRTSWLTFAGNVVFQQTQLVEPFGTNAALWSLGYEFTYYLIFPLVLGAVIHSGYPVWKRVMFMVVAVVVCVLGGVWVIALFFAWGIGAAVGWLEPRALTYLSAVRPSLLRLTRGLMVALLVASMMIDKIGGGGPRHVSIGSVLTALTTGLVVVLFLGDVRPRLRIGRTALSFTSRLGDSSYSLYATHLPVLTLLAVFLTPTGSTAVFEPDLRGWSIVVFAMIALTAAGWLFARYTEEFYKPTRDWTLRKMHRQVDTDPNT